MKFSLAILVAFVLAVDANGVRGLRKRNLQGAPQLGAGSVGCISVTNADGTTTQQGDCTTTAPVAVAESGNGNGNGNANGNSNSNSGKGGKNDKNKDTAESVSVEEPEDDMEDGTAVSEPVTPGVPANLNTPPPQDSLVDIVATAQITPATVYLPRMVSAAGLTQTLQGPGPFTVFAPNNEAWPTGLDLLTLQVDPNLADILTYHVVPGLITSDMIPADGSVELITVQGQPIVVGFSNTTGLAMVNDYAHIVGTDVEASNGIIHVIDSILIPPGVTLNNVNLPVAPTPDAPMDGTTPGMGGTTAPNTGGSATVTGGTTVTGGDQTGVGGKCAEYGCIVAGEVEGVYVCRGGFTTCTLPTATLVSDTCGCCMGDNRPECQIEEIAVERCEDC